MRIMAGVANAVLALLLPAFAQDQITVDPAQLGITSRWMGATNKGSVANLKEVGFNAAREFKNIDRVGSFVVSGKTPADVKAAGANRTDVEKCFTFSALTDNGTGFADNKAGGICSETVIKISQSSTDQAALDRAWMLTFGYVYQMNVVKGFGIDHWELGNEPDLNNSIPVSTYVKLASAQYQAISYLYQTFLPDRTSQVLTGALAWNDANYADPLAATGDWDGWAYHHYHTYANMTGGLTMMRGYANQKPGGTLWLTEWGTFDFSSAGFNPHNNDQSYVVMWTNYIQDMQFPDKKVDGFTYYRLTSGTMDDGLILMNGSKTKMWYNLRMVLRALQGGRPVWRLVSPNADVRGLLTASRDDSVHVLVTNRKTSAVSVVIDPSAVYASATQAARRVCTSSESDGEKGVTVFQGKLSLSLEPQSVSVISLNFGRFVVPPDFGDSGATRMSLRFANAGRSAQESLRITPVAPGHAPIRNLSGFAVDMRGRMVFAGLQGAAGEERRGAVAPRILLWASPTPQGD